jgi:hypothetical protein
MIRRAGPLLAAAALALAGSASAPPARSAPEIPPPSGGTTRWAPPPGDPDWVNVRAHGAAGDGVTDDTAAFRNAAATGKKLFVPKPPVAYKLTGFVRLRSSVRGDGSLPEIRMHGADGDPDQGHAHSIFVVDGYDGPGLTIDGLHLDGRWDGAGTRGEWSHCIRITSSRNVTIQNCILERPYGDCIFVGHYGGSAAGAPSHILIRNNTLRGPRRCCVAVIAGTNVTIRDNVIVKTSDYVAAIDLEPDPLGYQHVRGVLITNNAFDVAPIRFGGGAISLNNPLGNGAAPPSGDVAVTHNHGTWSPAAAYLRVAGSDGLVGIVPHLRWSGVTAWGNTPRPRTTPSRSR